MEAFVRTTSVGQANDGNRREHLSCRTVRAIAPIIVAVVSMAGHCRAAVIDLPSIGTDINYNYATSIPLFQVAKSEPADDVLDSQITFAHGKYLHLDFDYEGRTVVFDLAIGSPGIVDLFEPFYIPFNETASLLLRDGTVRTAPKNYAVGWDQTNNWYSYRWGFELGSADNTDVIGLRWTIVPDLVPDAVTPQLLDARFDIFVAGTAMVVPEPTELWAVGLLPAIAAISARRLRWCNHCYRLSRISMVEFE